MPIGSLCPRHRQEVPTVWEVIGVVIVCASIGWLIAVLADRHRHV